MRLGCSPRNNYLIYLYTETLRCFSFKLVSQKLPYIYIREFKGLAKLGNIVAETMFLVMFPGVAKLRNICFGRKICVREAKMFLTPDKNIFCFPSSKICFRNTCFPRG